MGPTWVTNTTIESAVTKWRVIPRNNLFTLIAYLTRRCLVVVGGDEWGAI